MRWRYIALGSLVLVLGGAIYLENVLTKKRLERPVVKEHGIEKIIKKTTISFEEACRDHAKREKYILDIKNKISLPEFADLEYVSRGRLEDILKYNKEALKQDVKLSDKLNAMTAPGGKKVKDFFAKKMHPKILVFYHAFESDSVKNEADLRSVIIQEIDHARFYHEGDERIDSDKLRKYLKQDYDRKPKDKFGHIVNIFMELRGTEIQMKKFTKKNSQKYMNHVLNYNFENYVALWRHDKKPLANDLKMLFFRKYMLTYLGQDEKGFYLEPVEEFKPITKRLYLPEGIKIEFK
ncbi:hypothetical protein KY332_02895 [Candidatus Woesearchaeota archaeon]|nr:hypothetical protein [Candidatus Woesearchaeota archaeon]